MLMIDKISGQPKICDSWVADNAGVFPTGFYNRIVGTVSMPSANGMSNQLIKYECLVPTIYINSDG